MSFGQRVENAKPYLAGFVLGLIAAPVIAFSAGWVSTSGARAAAVEDARVETLTGVCSHRAEQIAATQNTEPAAFKGFDNREKRAELVESVISDMVLPETLVKKVTISCNRTLS